MIKECQVEKGHTETLREKEGSRKEGQDAVPGWSSSLSQKDVGLSSLGSSLKCNMK